MRIALVLLSAVGARAQTGCAVTHTSEIRAGDLASRLPAFARLDAGVILAAAPQVGATRWLGPAELRRMGRAHAVLIDDVETLCVVREGRVAVKEEVASAMAQSLAGGHWHDVTFEVAELPRVRIPEDAVVTFPLSGLSRPIAGDPLRPLPWRGYARAPHQGSIALQAKVLLKNHSRVLAAARAIAAGAVLRAEDVLEQERPLLPSTAVPLARAEEAVGRQARRRIFAGEPIFAAAVREPLAIRRGDEVTVRVESGSARLVLPAIAESSAARSSTIVLLNPNTRTRFKAVVEGTGRAVVRLEEKRNEKD
jgi:flagella basal body P-ring formation protein FlgA